MSKNWSTAFITGGGSGIGLRLAEMLLQQGTNLALFDLSFSESVKERLAKIRPDATIEYAVVNVCDADAVGAAVDRAVETIGKPSIALNAAGIMRAGRFDELSQGDFEASVGVNLFGSRNFAAAVVPHLQPGSHIVFVASLAGLVPNYAYAAYNASKYGVVGLAGALRIELKEKGAYASVICPPEIMTPMVEEEKKTMHPITGELKSVAGTLELDEACDYIVGALQKRKFMIIPGFMARTVWRLNRWFPGVLQAKVDAVVRKHTA